MSGVRDFGTAAGAVGIPPPPWSGTGGGWQVPALLLGLSVGYVALWWTAPIGDHIWSPLGATMLHGDSPSFFFDNAASRYRWVGYPVFLAGVEAVFGTPAAVPRVQLVLAAAAACFLGWMVWRTRRAAWLAVTLTTTLFGLSAVARFHAYILSEGLFAPLLCALLGVVVRLARQASVRWAALGALLCGLAVTVRPAGMALLALWPFLGWLLWPRLHGRRWRLAAAVLLPLTVVFVVEAVVWRAAHGGHGERPSIVNRALFAKAVLVPDDQAAAGPRLPDADLARFLAEARREAAPLRHLIAAAPERHMRAILLRNAESAAEGVSYGLFSEPLRALALRRGESADLLLGAIGWRALGARPGAWLANAATHWLSMWTYYSVNDAAFAERYEAYVRGQMNRANARLFRDANAIHPVAADPEPAAVVVLSRLAGWAALACSVLAIGAALWQRLRRDAVGLDDDLVVAAVSALLLHGCVLVAACFNKALLRYFIVTWPLQAACALLVLHWAWGRWRARGRVSA